MKIITVDLPKEYIASLEKQLVGGSSLTSEYIRQLIKAFVLSNSKSFELFMKEREEEVKSRFYDFCINCEMKRVNRGRKNHYFRENIEVFELRFCCSCYDKFKDKTLDEFPPLLIEKIQSKIKEFKNNT